MQALANPSLTNANTRSNQWVLRFFPSLTDLAFILPAVLLFTRMNGSATLLADGDTGWHIRTGEWIWQHSAVPTTDLFSYTKPHDAWYAWEWLWDFLFAGIHHVGGLGAVAFASVVLLGCISVLLFRLVRRTTDNDLLSFAMAALAIGGSGVHWLARPHLFSWVFVLVFAHALLSARRGNRKPLYWLPVCMLLWTNLHGAFFLGIIMVCIEAAGEVIDAFLHAQDFRDAAYHRARPYVVCAIACAAVTLLNPYGWNLHAHIYSYVHDSKLLDKIGEYQSINFHNPLAYFFEVMLLLALPAVSWSVSHRKYASALAILFWAHLGLLSGRNIPLFVMLVCPSAALMIQDLLIRVGHARRLSLLATRTNGIAARFRPFERAPRYYVTSASCLVLLAVCFAAGLPGFEGQFDSKTFPHSALPFIKKARFSRLFTTDTWASYFVYNLYPLQPTFVDGRSDFFGHDMMDDYVAVINARFDWERKLDEQRVDAVALRPDDPVVSALKISRNWQLLFDNGAALIFCYNPMRHQDKVAASQVSPALSGGRKALGLSQPGLIVQSNTQIKERRSS